MRLIMIEYLYLICLLCLTVSVPVLIRGCFNIHKELPNQGGDISNRIDKVADLLDEMADIINSAIRFQEEVAPIAQTASSPLMNILSAFMSNNASRQEHGDEKKPQEWEVLPNDPEKVQTETITE